MPLLSSNAQSFSPYESFRFRVKWDGRYVAGVSKVGLLKRSTEGSEQLKNSDASILRHSPSRAQFEAITLEHEDWERDENVTDPSEPHTTDPT